MWINLDDFVSMSDYAKLVDKATAWVTIGVTNGKIPCIMHGKKKLIPKSGTLPDYINNQSLVINYINKK